MAILSYRSQFLVSVVLFLRCFYSANTSVQARLFERSFSSSIFGVTEDNVQAFLNKMPELPALFSDSFEDILTNSSVQVTRNVSLPLGKIAGRSCKKFPSVTEFLGIPYANPILGRDRFITPKEYSSKYPTPVLDATKYPPPCGSICGHMGSRVINASSEDCLFLNIWAPEDAVPFKSNLPVRVVIHGGAVTECSASDPNIGGCDFVKQVGIIQVNVQFRVGVFGYLAHPTTMAESNTTGNWGLIDQQLALKWIQDHISYFGGDPTKVLINGNSAGAQRVDFHMVLPGSKGLFSSAISQSPPCSRFISKDQAYKISEDFIIKAGCSQPLNSSAEVECLRELPWATLQNLSRIIGEERPSEIVMCESLPWKSYFHHVVDGTTVPKNMMDAISSNEYNNVPYMVGTNTADGREFVEMFYISMNLPISMKTLTEVINRVYPGADPVPVAALYPIEKYLDKFDPPRARLTALWTDIFFTCPVLQRVTAMNVFSSPNEEKNTYLYLFNASPTCPPGDEYYGPTHAAELMFSGGIKTGIFPPTGNCNLSKPEAELSDVMTLGWSTMASSQSPKWKSGEGWAKWSPKNQTVTFLDRGVKKSELMEYSTRCGVIQNAIDQALAHLLHEVSFTSGAEVSFTSSIEANYIASKSIDS